MAQQHTVGRVATTVRTTLKGWTECVYHSTCVTAFRARIDGQKDVVLDSGGWRTATTKTRMNQMSNQYKLGFHVFQKNHEWFVNLPNGETVDFEDNMVFQA